MKIFPKYFLNYQIYIKPNFYLKRKTFLNMNFKKEKINKKLDGEIKEKIKESNDCKNEVLNFDEELNDLKKPKKNESTENTIYNPPKMKYQKKYIIKKIFNYKIKDLEKGTIINAFKIYISFCQYKFYLGIFKSEDFYINLVKNIENGVLNIIKKWNFPLSLTTKQIKFIFKYLSKIKQKINQTLLDNHGIQINFSEIDYGI